MVTIPSRSADILSISTPARHANVTRTQKYMVPTVGINAVKASEDDDEEEELLMNKSFTCRGRESAAHEHGKPKRVCFCTVTW